MFPRAALLAFVLLQAALVVAATEEPCATAGATRCDASRRVLSTCDAHGRWAHADCASQGGVCLLGQCLPLNLTREAGDSCVHTSTDGDFQCSTDCNWVEYCTSDNVYIKFVPCGTGQYCDFNEPEKLCQIGEQLCQGPVRCASPGLFPNIEAGYCTSYYECPSDASESNVVNAKKLSCQDGFQFDPSTRSCSEDSIAGCSHQYDDCTSSIDPAHYAVSDNPSLHYTCSNRILYWMKCPSGSYNEGAGKCTGDNSVCPNTGTGDNGICNCDNSVSNIYCCVSSTSCKFCHCPTAVCTVRDCASGYYFSEASRKCVIGTCG